MATNSLGLTVDVSSSTKDSISVKWRLENPAAAAAGSAQRDLVQGFEVRYQAIGSTVVQYSSRLDASTSAYDIIHLHENTYYDICVKVFARLNATGHPPPPPPPSITSPAAAAAAAAFHADACTKGTTATDSLWVALGSTFGAFLALGFIVFLVFLAKWQHSRKERKQKLMTSANYDDDGDARVQQLRECDDDDDDDYDRKGSSGAVHLPDDLALSELSGHSSELSIALYADQMMATDDAAAAPGDSDDEGSDGGDVHLPPDEQRRSYHRRDHLHDWIAGGASYAAEGEEDHRYRSIDDDDSGIQRELLLRPPPIPGIILRPMQSSASSSMGTDHRLLSSTQRGSGDDSCRKHDDDDDDGNAAEAAAAAGEAAGGGGGGDRVIGTGHPPLKPRASNLW